jgi:uncharacterized protein DUF4058
MPLLDHFHPPLSEMRHWDSLHLGWIVECAGQLNQRVLPARYFAEVAVCRGGRIEADVATDIGDKLSYRPPPLTAVIPAVFPDEFEVQVFDTSGGITLVAAVELFSPGNKDRSETRRAFAAKCASYLQQGIGLVIVDVVTDRLANRHDELVQLLEQPDAFRFPANGPLYATAYRPARREPGGDQIDLWTFSLAVGQALPTVPLALRGGPTLPVDLELTYMEVRESSRL